MIPSPKHQDNIRNIVSELTGHKNKNNMPPKIMNTKPADPNSAYIYVYGIQECEDGDKYWIKN